MTLPYEKQKVISIYGTIRLEEEVTNENIRPVRRPSTYKIDYIT
jgi:hypothetical protein